MTNSILSMAAQGGTVLVTVVVLSAIGLAVYKMVVAPLMSSVLQTSSNLRASASANLEATELNARVQESHERSMVSLKAITDTQERHDEAQRVRILAMDSLVNRLQSKVKE